MANENLRKDLGIKIDKIMRFSPDEVKVGVNVSGGTECLISHSTAGSTNERRVRLSKPITPSEVSDVLRPYNDIDYVLQDPVHSDDGQCYYSLVRRHSL